MRDTDVLLELYTAGVIDRLGKDTTTSTSELRDYGVRHFSPAAFIGVYPADVTPERTRHKCFYITNTVAMDHPSGGEHWCAVGREPGRKDLVFDSFGRKPSATFLPMLRHAASTDPDVNQTMESTRCGQLCLGWGHVFMKHGYDVAAMC